MKKIIFRTMAIVLVLGVAACSRTDETADTPSDQKITELGVIAQSTRSTLGDDNWVEWDANDSFSVFSSMSFSSEFTIKELLDEGHGAKLEGMTIPADTYYILYPYIMDAMIAEGKIHARNIVPATQPLVENTFDHKQNPAVGHTEGAETVAPMKNIAGLVKVRVTGKIDLRRITLMSNSDNELIAGTGTIDAKTSELTIDESEGSASVTLTASKSIPLTDTPKTFYFVVAPRTFASGFTLTFIGSKEGKNYRFTHTTHNEATITASKILNITKVFDIDITEETVEMEPGITYTADKEIFISDNSFVPAALDSDYDETTKTGRIYFEKGVEVTKVGANAFESTALQTIDLPETDRRDRRWRIQELRGTHRDRKSGKSLRDRDAGLLRMPAVEGYHPVAHPRRHRRRYVQELHGADIGRPVRRHDDRRHGIRELYGTGHGHAQR